MRDSPPDQALRRGRDSGPSNPSLTATEVDSAQQALRVGAKGLVTAHGRVLLIKERRADGSSFWTIPGGGIEADESLPECLRREIEEEIRCRSTVGDVVDAYVYPHTTRPTTTVYTIFDVTLHADPDPNPNERIVECAWWEPADLPPTTLDPVRHVVENAAVPTGRGRQGAY